VQYFQPFFHGGAPVVIYICKETHAHEKFTGQENMIGRSLFVTIGQVAL